MYKAHTLPPESETTVHIKTHKLALNFCRFQNRPTTASIQIAFLSHASSHF